MQQVVIFGGTGYIGTYLCHYLLKNQLVSRVVLADIKPSKEPLPAGATYVHCDVKEAIRPELVANAADWVFNFAAIHREPGHEPQAYYETNIPGAQHVIAFAEAIECSNIYFTSSISIYGPTTVPTSEEAAKKPISPYGITKLAAEEMHCQWQEAKEGRRLIICRPGVVYGPGDPGNILRMVKAVQKGIFFLPGSGKVHKSYAYVEDLVRSMVFYMQRNEPVVRYNFVDQETLTLVEMVQVVKQKLGVSGPVISIPLPLLMFAAQLLHTLGIELGGIHPVRVKKAAMPTHILPRQLQQDGFQFQYDFRASLDHWMAVAPTDFNK